MRLLGFHNWLEVKEPCMGPLEGIGTLNKLVCDHNMVFVALFKIFQEYTWVQLRYIINAGWTQKLEILKPVQSDCSLGGQERFFETIPTLVSVSRSEQNSQRYNNFCDYSPFLWALLPVLVLLCVYCVEWHCGLAPRKFRNLYSVVDKILADLAIFQALHFNIAGSVLRGKTADLKQSP